MDLRSIRFFVHITDLGSITRASQHLGIAQPASSRHPRTIEDDLGTQVLVRLPQPDDKDRPDVSYGSAILVFGGEL